MTKPRLGKVRALFYVLQQATEKEAAPILTQPHQQTSVPRKFDKCSTQYGTLDSDDGFIDFKAK